MPTYNFRCPECNKIYEINCKISELDNDWVCDDCNALLKRVFIADSLPSVGSGVDRLKSPDWYKNRINKMNDDLDTKAEVYK